MRGENLKKVGVDHPSSTWSQEARDKVAILLQDGLSASQIGARIGVSRSAVIGIVARDRALKAIGFARADRTQKFPGIAISAKKHRGKRGGFVSKNRLKPVIVKATPLPPDTAGVSLMDLGPRQCRFCVNEPEQGSNGHLFCGETTEAGKSWCAFHEQIVWGRGTAAEAMRRAA